MEVFPETSINIPRQPKPLLPMQLRIAFVIFGQTLPLWVNTQGLLNAFNLSLQRAASVTLLRANIILESLWLADSNAAMALLCQSCGREVETAYTKCQEGSYSFSQCISLHNKFNNQCGNCIIKKERNCTLCIKYLVEWDSDYHDDRRR